MRPDFVRGDATGIDLPAHVAALQAGGAAWLTRAGHAFGSLAPDNRVVAVTGFARVTTGNSGDKARFSVTYARDEPGLPRTLFAKLSRDFADPFRDRRRFELAPEIRLAALSRHPAFPVAVPRAFFGDFHHASGTGVLVTEAIAFGEAGIEPLHPKCMDHELPDALAYYRALLAAQGRLAGAHRAGRLSPDADALFPFDRAVAEADLPIAHDEPGLRAALARLRGFLQACPLVPPAIASDAFLDRFAADVLAFHAKQAAVRRFLYADPAYFALAHWNTHVDNAWFWRDAAGALQCGLLDWGMTRQLNFGIALWGCLSCAEPDLLLARIEELVAHFAAAYHAGGGPRLDPAVLFDHLACGIMLLVLAMMIEVPRLVQSRVPAWAELDDRFDPRLRRDPVATGFLHNVLGALQLWESRDFGARLAGLAQS